MNSGMFIPTSYAVAFAMMFITMICWGTWANMQKIAKWRFELFYWDYSIGVLVLMIVAAFTLGTFGSTSEPFLQSLSDNTPSHYLMAVASGVIFNIANFLLVAAIAIAGMSVAFPVGIGIALVVGTFLSYAVSPAGNFAFIVGGVVFVLIAIILDAMAYRRIPNQVAHNAKRGLAISVGCGLLMGLFYPLLAASMADWQGGGGGLEPYTATLTFAVGLFITTLVLLPVMMRKPVTGEAPVSMSDYRKGPASYHAAGIVGGVIWAIGTLFSVLASTVAGPAVAYAFGQCATLIAAFMGVFVWKEFKGAQRVAGLLGGMFAAFIIGLILIGVAPSV